MEPQNQPVSSSSKKSRSQAVAKSEPAQLPSSPGNGPRIIATAQSFSGPLPHPDLLEAYERAQPGMCDRIVRMAESEQEHRQRLENREHECQVSLRVVGLLSAFVLALAGLLCGTYLVVNDKGLAGFACFLSALSLLIGAAIYKHKQSQKEPTTE